MERMYYVPWEIRVTARSICRLSLFAHWMKNTSFLCPIQSFESKPTFFHFLTSLSHEPWLLNRTGHLFQKRSEKNGCRVGFGRRSSSWPGWSGFLAGNRPFARIGHRDQKTCCRSSNKVEKLAFHPLAKKCAANITDAVRHVLLKDHPELDGFCLILEQLPGRNVVGIGTILACLKRRCR